MSAKEGEFNAEDRAKKDNEQDRWGHRDAQSWIEGFRTMRHRTAAGPVEAELVAIDDDQAVFEFPITDAARQPMGLLHGGVSLMMAETAASTHAAWHCSGDQAPMGIDINGTHLSSATDGRVQVKAVLLRKTRTFVFHDIEIQHMDTKRVLCRARVTNYLKSYA